MRIKKTAAGLLAALMILLCFAACAGSSGYDIPELHLSWDMTPEQAKQKCTVETTVDESSERTILSYIRTTKDKKVSIAGMTLAILFVAFDENGEMVQITAGFEDRDKGYESASISDIQRAFTKQYGEPTVELQSKEQLGFSSYTVYTYGWKTDRFVAVASGSNDMLGGNATVKLFPPTMSLNVEESNP